MPIHEAVKIYPKNDNVPSYLRTYLYYKLSYPFTAVIPFATGKLNYCH